MDRGEFDDWARATGPRLHRAAFLLTGSWDAGQDLVQHALLHTWRRFSSLDNPEAFARVVMARAAASQWRRRWRGEVPHATMPDVRSVDPWHDIDEAADVRLMLAGLTPRQRAVVVLRFLDDLSEQETARAMGWKLGTVKSTTSRALDALRRQDLSSRETLA